MTDLLITNLRPWGQSATDLLIRAGKIAQIGPDLARSLPAAPEGVAIEDAQGAIALPGLVEAHTHLDKGVWGMPWYEGRVGGTLMDLIDNERNDRARIGLDPHRQSMRQALALVGNGTSHIRSHVDIDTDHGLAQLEGVAQTREALRGIVDIQIVAFPQSGLISRAGTLALMEEALGQGADIVGGLDPSAIDRDPAAHLDAVFGLAERFGKPIDLHLHEPGELGAFAIEMICARTRALGLQGQVGISHGFCLGSLPEARARALMEEMAALDIALFTNGNPSQTIPSLTELWRAGVRVGAGCDGIRDTWGPWGQPDMLRRLQIIGMKNRLRRDDELERLARLGTTQGAAAMGITGHDLTVGSAGDLTLVTGETLAHAIVDEGPRPLVVKGGTVVARAGHALRDAP